MKTLIILLFISLNVFANYNKLLYAGNCLTCHKYEKSISAPSLMKIRNAYLNAFPKKEDFIYFMSAWVLNPNKTTSIMSEAIKVYKIMPYLAYEEQSLQDIALFIYEYKK